MQHQYFEFRSLIDLAKWYRICSNSMPARNSSMELSSPSNPDMDRTVQPSRRRSNRVGQVRRKSAYSSPHSDSGAAKRKRSQLRGGAASPESEEEDEGDYNDSDGEPDQEKFSERKRPAKKTKLSKASNHAAANGISGAMAVRTVASRPKRGRRAGTVAAADAHDVGGLYGR